LIIESMLPALMPKEQSRPTETPPVVAALPIGLAHNPHPETGCFQHTAQNGHRKARMIDVGVAGHNHHIHRVPAARLRHVDHHLVIVDKPPRMLTLRHRAERDWPPRRKAQQPTLDEILPQLLLEQEGNRAKRGHRRPRVYCVHRIDRDTSGLLVFARDEKTQKGLIAQFACHDVGRAYMAVVPGHVAARTFTSNLIRDRGDGLRGSTADPAQGQCAVTHVQPIETVGEYTLLECRLETGRTHQIRIHLTELGHPICGDPIYRAAFGQPPIEDHSGAPRLALHAARLQFVHPASGEQITCESPLPDDLSRFVDRLRAAGQSAT
jgi:23S rRNA pseudouridine1911/1915/1917 synthase